MTNGSAEGDGPQLYKEYPLASVAAYNGATLAHDALGALGMIVGYGKWPALGWTLGLAYLVFAVVQMYVLMPLMVCPGCVYRRMDGARCISALNLVSAKIAAERWNIPSGPPDIETVLLMSCALAVVSVA